MNITYRIDYNVAAMVLFIVETIYVRIQYSHDRYSNRLFIMLLHSSFLFAIVDTISSVLLTRNLGVKYHFLLRSATNMYFLCLAFLFLVFYRYIVEYLDDKGDKTVGYYVRTYFPFIFIVECLIANHYANIFFASGKYGHFSYGYLILIIYIYPVYYFVLTLICLVRNREHIGAKQVVSVMLFFITAFISVVVQLLLEGISTLPFACALSLLVMIFTLETPDYRGLIKAKESLNIVSEELNQRNAFYKALLTDFSNEIVTPIGKLIEKNDTCSVDAMNEQQKEIYEYVDGYGRQARSVINNVMEFIMIDDERAESEAKEYSVREIVGSACSIMMPAVKDASNELTIDIDQNVPKNLMGNAPMLKQIMINFLSNAVDTTHDGDIRLMVSARQIDSGVLNLIVSVEDSGAGMKRDAVRKLLRFNTESRNWRREHFNAESFRIRITKKMIEQMNGKLSIDSAPGKGSLFTAVIPQTVPKDMH